LEEAGGKILSFSCAGVYPPPSYARGGFPQARPEEKVTPQIEDCPPLKKGWTRKKSKFGWQCKKLSASGGQGAQILRSEVYLQVRRNDEGSSATPQMDFLRSHQERLGAPAN
jgi:hypothetical protein